MGTNRWSRKEIEPSWHLTSGSNDQISPRWMSRHPIHMDFSSTVLVQFPLRVKAQEEGNHDGLSESLEHAVPAFKRLGEIHWSFSANEDEAGFSYRGGKLGYVLVQNLQWSTTVCNFYWGSISNHCFQIHVRKGNSRQVQLYWVPF